MSNPVLQSEAFQKAAYEHSEAMQSFARPVENFSDAVCGFVQSVTKLQRVLGMQAANNMCQHEGRPPEYGQQDFNDA